MENEEGLNRQPYQPLLQNRVQCHPPMKLIVIKQEEKEAGRKQSKQFDKPNCK